MEMGQQIIVNTEVEWEVVSLMVQEAFKLWSEDSTNVIAETKMNRALDEAYGTGVRIAVKITPQALDSPEVVNKEIYGKLQKVDPWMQDEVVISSVQDNPRSSRIYRGRVTTAKDSGFLSLAVIVRNKSFNFANLKPDEIVALIPIRPIR